MAKQLMTKAKKAVRIYKDGGMRAVVRKVKQIKSSKGKTDLIRGYDFIINTDKTAFDQEAYEELKKSSDIVINWVIPLPGIGSGGHINIFRFICNLQKLGFKNRVYTMNGDEMAPDEQFHEFVDKYYGVKDRTIELHHGTGRMKCAHATIATSWETAYIVNNFDNTVSKFYFVQDFEPYFFPLGSRYSFAENTYKFGFRGITAGGWLKEKLHDEYGMETEGFGFSYDRDLYQKKEKHDDRNRIFYYARPFTERRSFEMGLLVLNALSKKVPDLEIVMAGSSLEEYEIHFPYTDLGTVELDKLSELYAQCDMCLVLSHTNLSLLPLEIMASNSVVVCNRGANSEWLVNDGNAVMVESEPLDIIEKVSYYFEHKDELEHLRKKGMEFAKNTSWMQEAEKVAAFIKKGVKEDEESIGNRR